MNYPYWIWIDLWMCIWLDAEWRESYQTTRKWESIWISSWEAAQALVPRESQTFASPFVLPQTRAIVQGTHAP